MEGKLKQLPLPNQTIEVKLPSGVWQKVEQLPTQGRYRIKRVKRPSDKK